MPVAGIDDKRQLIAILSCSMTGDFLPPQLIYQGKIPHSLPSYKLPADWDVTYTSNHWANEVTSLQYLSKIILPLIEQKQKGIGIECLPLVLFNHFKGQITKECLQALQRNHIHHVLIQRTVPTDRSLWMWQ